MHVPSSYPSRPFPSATPLSALALFNLDGLFPLLLLLLLQAHRLLPPIRTRRLLTLAAVQRLGPGEESTDRVLQVAAVGEFG